MEIGIIREVEKILSQYENVKLEWTKKNRVMYLTWINKSVENRLELEKVEKEQQLEQRQLYWSMFLKGIQEKILQANL